MNARNTCMYAHVSQHANVDIPYPTHAESKDEIQESTCRNVGEHAHSSLNSTHYEQPWTWKSTNEVEQVQNQVN